jgi:hypothetical protein
MSNFCSTFAENLNYRIMENEQKKTDYQILLEFLHDHGNWSGSFGPNRMIQEALHYLEFYQNINSPISAISFLPTIFEHADNRITFVSHEEERAFIYTFVTVIYIIFKAEGVKNEYQQKFLTEIENDLKKDTFYNAEKTENAIQQMVESRKTAPKFYNPLEEIKAIAGGKQLNQVEWHRLLFEMFRYAQLSGSAFPFFLVLHTFLVLIPNPKLRVKVLGHLKDAALQKFNKIYIDQFIEDVDMLEQVYLRLHALIADHPLPNLWPHDPSLRELVLWMNDLSPEELVALAQAALNRSKLIGAAPGIQTQVLQIPRYINKIQTDSGLEFCQGLYFAEGDRQWIQSGVGDEYRERPTLDTHSVDYRNKCYALFLRHRVSQLQKEYLKDHKFDKAIANYHAEVLQDLRLEYHYRFKNGNFQLEDRTAYTSLKARMEDMIAYFELVCKNEVVEEPKSNSKFKYIISDDEQEILKIHKRIEIYLSSPAKLRDELRRLQDEALMALPMENPTAIVRELQRVWGDKAPKEGSFKTTWGRLKC